MLQVLQFLTSFWCTLRNSKTQRKLPSRSNRKKPRTAWESNCWGSHLHRRLRHQIQTCIAGDQSFFSWTPWQILLFSARDSTALSHKTRWLSSWRRTWPPAWSTSLCPRSPPPPSPPLPFSPSTWGFWHLGPFSFGVTRLCSSFGSDSLQTYVPKNFMWEVMHTQSFFELFDNKIGHCFK